jgi:mono/diheme cytochrome c family protein
VTRPGRICAELAPVLCLLAGCRLDQSVTDRALERMSEQPKYDVYQSSRFFRNGMAMQLPPAGTIARDAILDPARATGRTASGGYLTAVPLSITPQLLQMGRSRFHIYCAVCHGAGGYGGSIVASNLAERRPPSLRSGAVSSLPAGFFYDVIRRGLGRMPSYAAELPVDQRWAVVAYVQQLQRTPKAGPGEREDSIRGAELHTQDSLLQASGDSLR